MTAKYTPDTPRHDHPTYLRLAAGPTPPVSATVVGSAALKTAAKAVAGVSILADDGLVVGEIVADKVGTVHSESAAERVPVNVPPVRMPINNTRIPLTMAANPAPVWPAIGSTCVPSGPD